MAVSGTVVAPIDIPKPLQDVQSWLRLGTSNSTFQKTLVVGMSLTVDYLPYESVRRPACSRFSRNSPRMRKLMSG
jgi:hypothetical protein